MTDDKYKISYTVRLVFPHPSYDNFIVLCLSDFSIGESNDCSMLTERLEYGDIRLWLRLDQQTLNELTNLQWIGTEEDILRVKKDLEGKVFELDLGLKQRNKLHPEGLENADRLVEYDSDQ